MLARWPPPVRRPRPAPVPPRPERRLRQRLAAPQPFRPRFRDGRPHQRVNARRPVQRQRHRRWVRLVPPSPCRLAGRSGRPATRCSAQVDLAGFGLGSVGFVFTDDAGVAVSVARPGITASLGARPLERAIIVEDRLPFGSGWIPWRAVPRLAVDGRLELLGHDQRPGPLLRLSRPQLGPLAVGRRCGMGVGRFPG